MPFDKGLSVEETRVDEFSECSSDSGDHPTKTILVDEPRLARASTIAAPIPKHSKEYPRLSRPFELIRHQYDVIVIGSGYGGGVAASRMARAGKSVCVLERGHERWPGEYPSTLIESIPELHVSGELVRDEGKSRALDNGDKTGLYHLIAGDGQNAFVANGLGGTSLLNANVFIRADDKTLAMKDWPPELRVEKELEPYYEMAEEMLEPATYPEDWPEPAKLKLLQKQAEVLGHKDDFRRVKQTTRFVDGPNSTGIEMKKSTCTGNDSTGINDGSKTTTLVTYISDAWNWGAEIFCQCEVRYVQLGKHGYDVYLAWHGGKRARFEENFYEDLICINAKEFVFFGAGSLGTTEILLRSKANGLELSDHIGQGMSGNGDILSFGYNSRELVNAMGTQNPDPKLPVGPTITGIIDCRNVDPKNPLNGYVIEEGAIPEALVPIMQAVLAALPGKIHPKNLSFKQRLERALANFRSAVHGPYSMEGSMQRTQVYLVMSHDSNQAIMTLDHDRPNLKYLGVGRSEHVRHINSVLARATNAIGGTLINNPFYASLRQQEITVHPIGGACISADGTPDRGSTTHVGELLTGHGTKHYPGLVVVDGAAIPTALGANPFATITALAERSVKKIAEKHGIKIDYKTKNGLLDPKGKPAHPFPNDDQRWQDAYDTIQRAKAKDAPGIQFTEMMSGHIHVDKHRHENIKEFDTAERQAKALSQTARFFLTMHAWDEDSLLMNPEHTGLLTGTFTHAALPASPYTILRGKFQLFNQDPRTPETTNLSYDMEMIGTDGSKLLFNGYKIVNDSVAGSLWDTWKATSTLRVEITDPKTKNIVGRGVLNIAVKDLISELKTLAPYGNSKLSRILSPLKFINFFAYNVFSNFTGPFGRLQWPDGVFVATYNKAPASASYTVKASDGVETPLLCWEPTASRHPSQQPVRTILFVPGAAVDHGIYATPTIKRNAIETFTAAGFRCYVMTHRVGRLEVAKGEWTGYDARLDVAAALKFIRHKQNNEKVYVVAHCVGAVAFCCGLLDGTIPCEPWLQGITFSNLSFTPRFPLINRMKTMLPIQLTTIYRFFAGNYFSCEAVKHSGSWVQWGIDQLLRFYPVQGRKELCNNASCHRTSLPFGRLWNHENLNNDTHSQIDHYLMGVNMTCLSHLVACGKAGTTLMNDLKTDLVTDENLDRLKDVPIHWFSGQDNKAYAPENTDIAFSMMRDRFGPDLYERHVFPGKGHLDCWMSDAAAGDVWRAVLTHVRQCFEPEQGF